MSRFGGEDLFGSGPHRFEVGGLSLRHVLHETPGGRGVELSSLGRSGRSIKQAGDLVADDPNQLQGLIGVIEAKLDGGIHTLIDDTGRSWLNTVMLSIDLSPVTQVGNRARVSYRIAYLQVTP